MSAISLEPVGVVRNAVREAADDIWGGVVSRIELDPARFTPEALKGLNEFSHVEILFALDRVPESKLEFGARHPRGRFEYPKVGIFAQRARVRPNRLGATVCRLRRVDGLAIEVEGLDAIDGTPVLDIKPYLREFGPRGKVRQARWATEVMASYWGAGGAAGGRRMPRVKRTKGTQRTGRSKARKKREV